MNMQSYIHKNSKKKRIISYVYTSITTNDFQNNAHAKKKQKQRNVVHSFQSEILKPYKLKIRCL